MSQSLTVRFYHKECTMKQRPFRHSLEIRNSVVLISDYDKNLDIGYQSFIFDSWFYMK